MSTAELLARVQAMSRPDIAARRRAELTQLTDQLSRLRPHAESEYDRFLAVRHRGLASLPLALDARLGGLRILVTGGSGCIGAALVAQLARYRPAQVVSVARRLPPLASRQAGVEYWTADIRDARAMAGIFARARPDLVFHLAALRDPGRAEREPVEAITTNVVGTHVVLASAIAAGTETFVYASTGKAVRFYASEIYAATKLVGEAMVAAAGAELAVGAARFTHVVDNSLILAKLQAWMRSPFIGLHHPDIAFYAQSATESAQLLLLGALAEPGEPRLHGLHDLGRYFELLDLALGLRAKAGSASAVTFTGFAPGYQSRPHRAQYDPSTLDDVGPLFNSLEAQDAYPVHAGTAVGLAMDAGTGRAIKDHVAEIIALAATPSGPDRFQAALDRAARELAHYRFARATGGQLGRLRRLAGPIDPARTHEHSVIDLELRDRLLTP